MRHILFISHARGAHGAETVMVQAIRACLARGARVTLVVPSIVPDEGLEAMVAELPNLSILCLPCRAIGGHALRTPWVRAFNRSTLRRLIAYVRREAVDTIYSNTSITILGADLACRTRVRHIWHWHETADAMFGFHPSLRPLYRRLTKTAHVLFISRRQKQGWETCLNIPIDGSVLYNPIKQIHPMKSEDSAPHDDIRIGFIGHFEARKNIPLLVHAFERLHAHTPNTSLWLCGARGAADIRFVEQMTTLREPVLHILPQTLDVSAFYHQIDILVLPSWRETMPLVVLEAMQAGVCVIQTNQSGMNELIEDGKETFFFSPDDAETLYRLLTQCMNPDFRQTIAQAGQKKVLQLIEHSSFDAQITQLLCA